MTATILVLVGCAGAVALSWEILWQHYITLAVGVSAVGTAVTVATTMAGMTAGALAMGRVLERRTARVHPMRLYGGLEVVIGLSGLLAPPGFALLARLDTWLYGLWPGLAPGLQIVGIALLLGPPTLAMGATLPVFALVARAHSVSIGVLYGVNTAGAALGVLSISLLLLPAIGVERTGLLAAALNGTVFAATWVLFREPRAALAGWPDDPPRSRAASPPVPALALGLVFGSGFVTFGLEVAWFRSLRAAFHATTESFAIILVSVLVPLAVAAQLVPWLRRRGLVPWSALAAAGAAILVATPLVERMDLIVVEAPKLAISGATLNEFWLGRVLQETLLSMLILGPAMVCLGTVLPWHLEEFGGPGQAGRIYAANTLGSVTGSLLAAWVLLPNLGFARAAWGLGGLTVVLSLAASRPRARLGVTAVGAVALAAAISGSSSVGRDRVQLYDPGSTHEIVAYREGPDATISVVKDGRGDHVLVIDGFLTASERDGARYMEWMGRLPMLLHPAPRRVLVICFGTGRTAHGVLDEGAERIDVVELNRAVLEFAPHFASNEGVLRDRRVRSIVMDGRAWIRRDPTRYDVVTLEPMAPYFAGANALYSREFYELVADRLAAGGVVAQWLPLHLLPPFHAASVAATFQAVFPDSALWISPERQQGILLGRLERVGGRELGAEWPGLARVQRDRPLPDAQVRRRLVLGSRELAAFAEGGEVITDDNQLLAYSRITAMIAKLGPRPIVEANLRRIREAAERGDARPPR